ncbi:FRG domain-containing protein [Flaviaesturariibacter flavus]|uniref:FRG domain-containing protein n=1 Tax=Flaviaesturariibacter flavus TaxID=2502780 RepID=A0A4R1BKE1_9BACT|nr:FRG domain-containing protein [Flaviaesturariibacter flavus]TCJ17779.1 FRG domain-containing protein [Flaviaesturariibacter flavus]
MESLFTTVRLDDWTDFRAFMDELSESWVFRGQAFAGWALQNAIERTDFIGLHSHVEADFLAEFQRGARNYLSRDQIPEHLIEWLALMQHHGAPTRLLDFTKSPFIAAYFAYEICDPLAGGAISVWAININYLKARATEELSRLYPDELGDGQKFIHERLFEKIFYDNKHALVFPVEPFRMNRRYSLQQSTFVSTGRSDLPFMEQLQFLGAEMPRAVLKIESPAALQKEVLRELQRMNLHRASLFPDLDGYAASLRIRYNALRSPEELLSEQLRRLGDTGYPYLP